MAPEVELLWWAGCPSAEPAIELVRAEMTEAGLDPDGLVVREIGDQAQAEGEGFVGSPTIRVAGRDVQNPGGEPVGLTCRIYRLRDGGVSPLPDRADVAAALAAALEAGRGA
jgi:hypothetical protein